MISSLSGFVHGDIRCHNIIFSKDTSHLIDFDLAKDDGVGKYPGGYNSSFPERHQHALEYQLMKKEHDRFYLAKIMENVCVRSAAACAEAKNIIKDVKNSTVALDSISECLRDLVS